MKHLIFTTSFIFLFLTAFSQVNTTNVLPFKDGSVNYSGTIQIDSTLQKNISIRAKRWFIQNFSEVPKAAIILEEPEGGMLIGKAGIAVYETVKLLGGFNTSVWFTIQFTMADNQCSYEFKKFLVLAPDRSQYFPLENYTNFNSSATQNEKDFQVGIDLKIKALIRNMEQVIDPNRESSISSYLHKFNLNIEKGDTLSALKSLKEANDKFEGELRIIIPLLSFYQSNSHSKLINNYFDKTITQALDQKNYSSYYHQGLVWKEDGKEEDAIRAFEVAIQVKPDEGMPYFYIGYIHHDRAVKLKASNGNPVPELLKVKSYWESAYKYLPYDKNLGNNIKALNKDIERENKK